MSPRAPCSKWTSPASSLTSAPSVAPVACPPAPAPATSAAVFNSQAPSAACQLVDSFAARAIILERMRNIKLTIAYDGADFHGWQFQPGFPTIQGAIDAAARKITQERIVVHGASRTDAGVHALGQVGHFKTASLLSAEEFQRALNALLPPTIRIVASEEVGHDFHSRWLAQGKTYRYRIFRGRVLPPFDYRRALHYPWPLDEAAMSTVARLFEGERDFTSFAASS